MFDEGERVLKELCVIIGRVMVVIWSRCAGGQIKSRNRRLRCPEKSLQ